MSQPSPRVTRGLALALVFLLAAGGVAAAAIPASNGVITGCYSKTTGALRVIDAEAGATCAKSEKRVTWNQQGPRGKQGVRGPKGAQGPPGVLYYAQQQAVGPLQGEKKGEDSKTFTFPDAPAGQYLIRVEGSAFRASGLGPGLGSLTVDLSPSPTCGSQEVRRPTLYFNEVDVHRVLLPMEWPVCFETAGTRSVTISSTDLATDHNDFFTVTLLAYPRQP
jgi:hypothetical protein